MPSIHRFLAVLAILIISLYLTVISIERDLIKSATGEIIAGVLFLIILLYIIIFSYLSFKNKYGINNIRKKQNEDLDFLKEKSKY
jgi:Gpi18-like mannosyltransferase